MTEIQFTTVARLLRRRRGMWQIEYADGGMAEFRSATDAIEWLLARLSTDELHIIVPDDSLPEAA